MTDRYEGSRRRRTPRPGTTSSTSVPDTLQALYDGSLTAEDLAAQVWRDLSPEQRAMLLAAQKKDEGEE